MYMTLVIINIKRIKRTKLWYWRFYRQYNIMGCVIDADDKSIEFINAVLLQDSHY